LTSWSLVSTDTNGWNLDHPSLSFTNIFGFQRPTTFHEYDYYNIHYTSPWLLTIVQQIQNPMAEQEAKVIQSAEETSAAASVDLVDQEAQGWDEQATRRLLRRLDWHIIPIMSLIYL